MLWVVSGRVGGVWAVVVVEGAAAGEVVAVG